MRKRLPLIAVIVLLAGFGIGFLVTGVNDLGTSKVMCNDRVMTRDGICFTLSPKGSGDAFRNYDEQRTHDRWTGIVTVVLGFGLIALTIPLVTSVVEYRDRNDDPH